MRTIAGVIVVIWLLIGVLAAYQRGYFGHNEDVACKRAGDTALTIIAGPLNYMGVNPKISCDINVPQPSN